MREKRLESLDRFRIVAALLVVAIHTSPFTSYYTDLDFFVTRVLGRVAVPFFFMVTGQFVVSRFPDGGISRVFAYVKKIALLYGAAILLYIPIGIYAGQYRKLGVTDVLRMLLFDGTFYHLWYFPACIVGVMLVYGMYVLYGHQSWNLVFITALCFYVIGLFGDSYYGLAEQVPVAADMYAAAFQIFSYTRNGIFMAPVFLLLGVAAAKQQDTDVRVLCGGLVLSFLSMTAEAFVLRYFQLQRHDSMYVFLLPVMFFLYQLLLSGFLSGVPSETSRRRKQNFRHLGLVSTWIYILHPAMILVVRGIAKITKIKLLTENSLIHYLAVLVCSAAAAVLIAVGKDWMTEALQEKPDKRKPAKAKFMKRESTFSCGRAWVELDRKALQNNVAMLQSMLPSFCRLMPALKADAYGHGAFLIADELQEMGVDAYCVAGVQEGAALRRYGISGEILVLGYTHPEEFGLLHQYGLTQTVIDYSYALQLNSYGMDFHVHIGVDTGMHRIGERSENLERIAAMFHMEHLIIDGIFTHLCTSDTKNERDRNYTRQQVQAFYKLIQGLEAQNIPCPKIHMQASYGVLNYPELAGDYARVGIALYGILSTKEDTHHWQEKLQPVLSLKARIAAVKTLYAGESAGYGIQFTAAYDMKIAVLTIGYADGLPRALSDGVGSVLVHGQEAPVIGRICMDQTIVDVSTVEDVRAGDTAVLIGRSGGLEISVCDLAEQAGTITNEILSRMGARLERVVV